MLIRSICVLSLACSVITVNTASASSCSDGAGQQAQVVQASLNKEKGTSAMKAHEAVETAKMNIVETAVAAGSFNTLVAAVKAAGLVETLSGKGPFTVFAPTDDAFAKLPKGTLENLLKPENKGQLTAILTYHVVPGQVTAADVVKLEKAKTVQGQEASIEVSDGNVMVAGAKVVQTDIMTSNGVIHVIDTVMLPPAL